MSQALEPKIFYCPECKDVEEVSYFTYSLAHSHGPALIALRQLSWREYTLYCDDREALGYREEI